MGDLLELSARIIDSGVVENAERSLMSKGIFAAAARDSEEVTHRAGGDA